MNEIKIGRMVLGSCATNTYFLYRADENKCIVVDPADYGDHIFETLQKNGLEVAAILLTHGHFDHIWGCEALQNAVNAKAKEEGKDAVKVYASALEEPLLKDAGMNISRQAGRACTLNADVYLQDGATETIAAMTFQMISTPGHTGGGCCYYFAEAGILISGDTLFQESVGRTDFPTGDMGVLVRSIKEKLFVLPDDTKVYPGHGDSTTIGSEKLYNPFCV